MKPLPPLLLLLWCLACRSPSEESLKGTAEVGFVAGSSSSTTPTASIPDDLVQRVQAAQALEDLLVIDRFVALDDAQVQLKAVDDAALVGQTIAVLDFGAQQISQYSLDGAFLRLIGRQGEGPGEYVRPRTIGRCYGDQLAVCDRGEIRVFDQNGVFQFATRLSPRVYPGRFFDWTHQDRLALIGVPMVNPRSPWHVLVDGSKPDFPILGGFGQRPALDNMPVSPAFSAFENLYDAFWVADPYSTEIRIYNRDGQLVTQQAGTHPAALKTDDWPKALENEQQFFEIYREKLITTAFLPWQGQVVVQRELQKTYGLGHEPGGYADILDRNGKTLRRNLKIMLPFRFFDQQGTTVLGAYDENILDMREPLIKKAYGEELFEKLKATGQLGTEKKALWVMTSP
ncbi:MAG: hypothetical protein QNK37_00120 [Acidobacteriota bacterium]|nr:hypothetical protein [Acidobacteriota bacterium]